MSLNKIPSVYCLKTPTPSPSFQAVCRLVLALICVYFMISAWDDFLDEALRETFQLEDTLSGRLLRAFIASGIAVLVLMLVRIDIDDLMGVFIHEEEIFME